MPYDSTVATQSIAPPPLPTASPEPIAHWAHTLVIVAFFLYTALVGHMRAVSAVQAMPQWMRYSSMISYEWLLLGAVVAGIYHRREFFLTAFANRARSLALSIGLGVAIYCTGFVIMALVGGALYFTPLFHKHNTDIVLAMMPHTVSDLSLWIFVSLSAGVCEELIFRGYLQQQVTAWTKRPIVAIVCVGALFGAIHLYEGVAAVVALAALGIVYGLLVRYFNGDLRGVIVAHTLQDFLTALFLLARPFAERHPPHP